MSKNEKIVQAIVEDMKKYASGDFFMHNGELYSIDTDEFCKKDGCLYREGVYIMPDGEKIADNDLENATIGDYFDDFYDIDYVIGSDKHYKACRVLVAFGGPNIYIDTWKKEVQLFWWSDTAIADIPEDLCMVIDDFFEVLYNC